MGPGEARQEEGEHPDSTQKDSNLEPHDFPLVVMDGLYTATKRSLL